MLLYEHGSKNAEEYRQINEKKTNYGNDLKWNGVTLLTTEIHLADWYPYGQLAAFVKSGEKSAYAICCMKRGMDNSENMPKQ